MNDIERLNNIKKALEELCLLVDEFAKCDLTLNTPLYNFQQSMVANVKRFRENRYD